MKQEFVQADDQVQIHSSIQIYTIKNSRKKWQAVAFFFVLVTVILSTSLWIEKNKYNTIFITNPKIYASDCSKLQLNNSNLTQFQFRMQFLQTKRKIDNNELSQRIINDQIKIIQLDLSQNKLQKFEKNSLKHLQKLNLNNNPLLVFSNNKFPKLKTLKPWYIYGYIQDFRNNYLPELIQEQTKFLAFSQIYNFSNNHIPRLNVQLYLNSEIKKFETNIIGATIIYITSLSEQFLMINNTMSELKQLFITHNFNNLKIINNSVQKLQVLVLSGVSTFQNNGCSSLKEIRFSGEIRSFVNLNVPQLQQLQIQSYVLNDICTGNNMPNLINVKISSDNLANVNCLNNSKKINSLDLDVFNFANFNLPNLVELWLNFNQVSISHAFANNSFSNISSITIYSIKDVKNFKDANISIGSSLKNFQLAYTNLTNFDLFDKQMPNLNDLQLQSNKLTNLNCSTFKNIQILSLAQNKLKDDIVDTLISCNFNKLKNIYLEENLILDKIKAKARLLSRYPNTFISI